MKITFKIWSGLLMVLLLTSACDLDLEPVDEITDDKAFITIDDLDKGRIGVMAQMNGFAVIGQGDRASDDLRYAASNRGQGVSVHDWTFTASTSDLASAWNSNAHLVDAANRVLEEASRFDQENDIVKQAIAECRFTRAFAVFETVRLYCPNYAPEALGTPYLFKSEIIAPSRLSQQFVYQYILEDIDAAIPDLLQFDEDNNYWITQSAAYALKARVAQYMGDWDMAIQAADLAISTGDFRLAEIDEFQGVWDDELLDKVEVIFRKDIVSSKLGEYYTSSTNGDIYFHPSYDLMSQYEDDDVRKSIYFGKDDNNKDIVTKHDGREEGETNVVDIKYFRVSELVLIKAEAYVEKHMLTEAKAELNKIRTRRIVDPLDLDMSTQSLALKALQEERRRELAYEGHRFYDLRRWKLGIDRSEEDAPNGRSTTLASEDYHFVFPIPQDEIFANTNMVQNTGYGN